MHISPARGLGVSAAMAVFAGVVRLGMARRGAWLNLAAVEQTTGAARTSGT
ncbi:hypothetical protein [Curtobacterium sp. MCBA15_012]|uniref:hypothetical protein n=1 Tax=Curtobacterium sp. MCBA15_012 TaxID=1898738 RepID=UPI0015873740|nr:hypothetical protein [Curtobacterium sp. MCBA15_012]WIB01067.1 hypothetical protein QOL15_05060 [Curtobacterium sp. MCBA15_012]